MDCLTSEPQIPWDCKNRNTIANHVQSITCFLDFNKNLIARDFRDGALFVNHLLDS